MKSNKLFIDITVNDKEHRIDIKHDEMPNSAVISVDSEDVNARMRNSTGTGTAYFFEIDSTPVIITIIKKSGSDEYDYDCFVDEKSVQNDMPWSFGKQDYLSMLKWSNIRKKGFTQYLISQLLLGGLIGVILFFVIFAAKKLNVFDNFDISAWLLLVIALLPFIILYGAFAFIEWKDYEKSFDMFTAALNGDISAATAEPSSDDLPEYDISKSEEPSDVESTDD